VISRAQLTADSALRTEEFRVPSRFGFGDSAADRKDDASRDIDSGYGRHSPGRLIGDQKPPARLQSDAIAVKSSAKPGHESLTVETASASAAISSVSLCHSRWVPESKIDLSQRA
jgi:hypothetical protein